MDVITIVMSANDRMKCKGSIFVSKSGEIRDVIDDNDDCPTSQLFALDCSQWDQAECAIESIARSSPNITTWKVLTKLIQENQALAHCLLQLPLAVILKYITATYRRPREMCFDFRIETHSGIKEQSILYQEVYSNDFLVYSHPEVKEHVKKVHWILIDGTFQSCPLRFKQLVTIVSRDEKNWDIFSNPTCVDAITYD